MQTRSFRHLRLAVFTVATACSRVVHVDLAPIVTDRPDFTESSETVAPGVVQLESGASVARDGGTRIQSVGEVLTRVGLAGNAELRVGLNSYTVSRTGGAREAGFEDANIGTKVNLAQGGGRRPQVSFIAMTSLPTGGDAFRQSLLQPQVKLTAAADLGDKVSFSSNVNHAWVRETGARYSEWAASGSLGIGLTERVGSYVEYFGFYVPSAYGPATHYLNSGFTLALGPDMQVDVRGGIGLGAEGARNHFFGVGFSRRWRVGNRE